VRVNVFIVSAVGTLAVCEDIEPVPPFALNVTVWLGPLTVTEPSVIVRIVLRLAKVLAAAMAEYSRFRALVPAAITLNVTVRTVMGPVAPVAFAPLNTMCPVAASLMFTKPAGGAPEWLA